MLRVAALAMGVDSAPVIARTSVRGGKRLDQPENLRSRPRARDRHDDVIASPERHLRSGERVALAKSPFFPPGRYRFRHVARRTATDEGDPAPVLGETGTRGHLAGAQPTGRLTVHFVNETVRFCA